MAERSPFGTAVYGPDTGVVNGISNLAQMFSPAHAAEAALNKAHQSLYEAEARKAGLTADQIAARNAALSTQTLAAANYTPQQIAAIQAAQSNSVADIFRGVNLNNGAGMLNNPATWRQGAALLGEGSLAGNPKGSIIPAENESILSKEFQNQKDVAQIGADARIESTNARVDALERIAAGNNASREKVSAGRNETSTNNTNAKVQGAKEVAGIRAGAAGNKVYARDVDTYAKELDSAQALGGMHLDPVQANAIAKEMVANGGNMAAALKKFNIDPSNVQYDNVTQPRTGVMGGVADMFRSPQVVGKKFKDFNPPGAGVMAPNIAPSTPPQVNPQGQPAQDNGQPVVITDTPEGHEAYARLPAGAKYVDPSGQTRTKR